MESITLDLVDCLIITTINAITFIGALYWGLFRRRLHPNGLAMLWRDLPEKTYEVRLAGRDCVVICDRRGQSDEIFVELPSMLWGKLEQGDLISVFKGSSPLIKKAPKAEQKKGEIELLDFDEPEAFDDYEKDVS